MSDGKPRVEGTLALASAAGGGGDNEPPDHKLSRSSLTSLGNRLRAVYDREMRVPFRSTFWICSTRKARRRTPHRRVAMRYPGGA